MNEEGGRSPSIRMMSAPGKTAPSCPRADEPGSPRLLRVAVGGLPYFGRKMAALLDGDGWEVAYL